MYTPDNKKLEALMKELTALPGVQRADILVQLEKELEELDNESETLIKTL